MAHHHNVMQKNKDHTTGVLWKTANKDKKHIFENSEKKYKELGDTLNNHFKDLNNETNNKNISYTVKPTAIKDSDYHTMTINRKDKKQSTLHKTYVPSNKSGEITTFTNADDEGLTIRKNYREE
mgnify:CR=1 FL=1